MELLSIEDYLRDLIDPEDYKGMLVVGIDLDGVFVINDYEGSYHARGETFLEALINYRNRS